MKKSNVFSRHAFGKLQVHIVFATKYRKTVFIPGCGILFEAVRVFNELQNISMSNSVSYMINSYAIQRDHVHLSIEYSPSVALCDVVKDIKNVSSRLINKKLGVTGALWERGYYASSLGNATNHGIEEYLEAQNLGDDVPFS